MAKRGRPPLSDEEKAERLKNKPKRSNKPGISATKEGGYAAQKRYKANHPEKIKEWQNKRKERGDNPYEVKLRIPQKHRTTLNELTTITGLSISKLFVNAVEEKYGVVLHIDKNNHN